MKDLYVVTTINSNGNGDDMYSDIILITDDVRRAKVTKHQVQARKPLPGLDYNLLVAYTDVIYFRRTLNQVMLLTDKED